MTVPCLISIRGKERSLLMAPTASGSQLPRRLDRFRVALLRLAACVLVLVVASASAEDATPTPENVRLQLKWTHQFQFAGYYAAINQGYYRDAGLSVGIVEGGPTVDVVAEVIDGRADFGVGTSELLLDYANGKPVVVLGVIYQHSALALVALGDSLTLLLEDLIGRSVMIEEHSADLMAMFRREHVPMIALNTQGHSGDINDLVEGRVAAMSVYLTDEPFLLDSKGLSYFVFTPRASGVDFYGDNFFTRRETARQRPETVERFRLATVQGWRYAIEHPEEIVDLILSDYSQRKSREHLLFEAAQTAGLMTKLVDPGHMLRGRWEHIADTYVEVGMVKSRPDLDGFIYGADEPLARETPLWAWSAIGGSVSVLAFFAALSLRLGQVNRHLLTTNDELRQAMSEIKTLRGILPICSYCKKVRDDEGLWEQIEVYVHGHSDADFSHGICPDCLKKHHPDYVDEVEAEPGDDTHGDRD